VIFIKWKRTRDYNQNYFWNKTETTSRFESKFNELKQTISNYVGFEANEEIITYGSTPQLTWTTKDKITINLYGLYKENFEEIRMVIFKD